MVAVVLGTAAFAALGLFVAGVMRAEATLAAANLIYLLLLAGGAVVLPASAYGAFGDVARAAALWRAGRGHAQRPVVGRLGLGLAAGPRGLGRRRGCADREDVQVGVSALASLGPSWLRRLGWASLVANIGIVLTGGAVRLTSSGLGCPTWPRCTDESFTPHGALDYHSAIEFGNRTLTFVLAAVAIATFVSAWQSGRRDLRRLAAFLALSIPAQAVIGGFTVLTDLNPWIVSFHLLVSLAIISTAVLYLWRIDHPLPGARPRRWCRWPGRRTPWPGRCSTSAPSSPGRAPHAGDLDSPRNGLDPEPLSQLHADLVFLLVGLTVGLLIAVRVGNGTPGQAASGPDPAPRRAGPGHGRLRAVRHRPPGGPCRASTSLAPPWSSPASPGCCWRSGNLRLAGSG